MTPVAPTMDFVGMMYIVLHYLYFYFYMTTNKTARWIGCGVAVAATVGLHHMGIWE